MSINKTKPNEKVKEWEDQMVNEVRKVRGELAGQAGSAPHFLGI